jgi:hypothetical protein
MFITYCYLICFIFNGASAYRRAIPLKPLLFAASWANTRHRLTRRGGRVVEGASLENWYTGNRIEGSNPSLSAIDFILFRFCVRIANTYLHD